MSVCLYACLSGQSSGPGGLREPHERIRLPGIVEVVVASMAAVFDAWWQGVNSSNYGRFVGQTGRLVGSCMAATIAMRARRHDACDISS